MGISKVHKSVPSPYLTATEAWYPFSGPAYDKFERALFKEMERNIYEEEPQMANAEQILTGMLEELIQNDEESVLFSRTQQLAKVVSQVRKEARDRHYQFAYNMQCRLTDLERAVVGPTTAPDRDISHLGNFGRQPTGRPVDLEPSVENPPFDTEAQYDFRPEVRKLIDDATSSRMKIVWAVRYLEMISRKATWRTDAEHRPDAMFEICVNGLTKDIRGALESMFGGGYDRDEE